MNAVSNCKNPMTRYEVRSSQELARKLLFFGSLCLFSHISIAPAAGGLIIHDSFREVSAAVGGGGFVMGDGNTSMFNGWFIEDALASGSSAAGVFYGDSDQDSFVPIAMEPSIMGTGSAFASATAYGGPAGGVSLIARSILEVDFEVTTTGLYDLDAEVGWDGTMDLMSVGYAVVKLDNVTTTMTLGSISKDSLSPGIDSMFGSYLLETGMTYKLLAEVRVGIGGSLPGSYVTSGFWSVSLVPEPSTFMLCLGALMPVGLSRKRTFQNQFRY